MKQKSLLILIFLLISSVSLYSQVRKEVKIFKDPGSEVEIMDDRDILNRIKDMLYEDEDFEDYIVPPMKRMFDRLNLSEAQEKEFRKLNYELQKKQTDLFSKIRTAQIELRELMDADKIDRVAVEKKIKEIADLRLKLQLNRVEHWFNVNKILDEKQQKIWKRHFLMNEPKMKIMKFLDKGAKMRERCRIW